MFHDDYSKKFEVYVDVGLKIESGYSERYSLGNFGDVSSCQS